MAFMDGLLFDRLLFDRLAGAGALTAPPSGSAASRADLSADRPDTAARPHRTLTRPARRPASEQPGEQARR
ncbi:hypothetical protein [Micromonospora parva]|uniref:hypothetical protein n=1 Tax=Micromonospora parva TaxID=1464048 RepID=UPI0033EED920